MIKTQVMHISYRSCFKQNKVISKKWTKKRCSFHENKRKFDKVNIAKNKERLPHLLNQCVIEYNSLVLKESIHIGLHIVDRI